MPADRIVIEGARQHNLKGISLSIPHRAVTVVTGPSGSGKSTLAFDTLYAEGQRRYIESLSTYAKQFLDRMPKPAVDRIDGVAPAVAIEQKNQTTSARSTVGTATEIYDYLRLLWARAGRPTCHVCGSPVTVDSPSTATARLLEETQGHTVLVCFPLPPTGALDHERILESLRAMGFVRVAAGDDVHRREELPAGFRLDREHRVLLQNFGGLAVRERNRTRLADSIATAFAEGEGLAEVLGDGLTLRFSQHPRCVSCGTATLPLSSDTMITNAPDASARPSAARCRVPKWDGRSFSRDRGRIPPTMEM